MENRGRKVGHISLKFLPAPVKDVMDQTLIPFIVIIWSADYNSCGSNASFPTCSFSSATVAVDPVALFLNLDLISRQSFRKEGICSTYALANEFHRTRCASSLVAMKQQKQIATSYS